MTYQYKICLWILKHMTAPCTLSRMSLLTFKRVTWSHCWRIGSGKSVTALSIMKLPYPRVSHSGNAHIFYQDDRGEHDLMQLSDKNMRAIRGKQIGMIFQEPMTSLNRFIP